MIYNVTHEDFNDFVPEVIIAAQASTYLNISKKLIAQVNLVNSTVMYIVKSDNQIVFISNSLDAAIEEYNNIWQLGL